MTKIAHYTIIRFRPFPETGEFANVGIVVFDVVSGHFAYKVVPKRFRRVTQFFNTLEANTFSSALSILQDELDRLSEYFRFGKSISPFLIKEMLRGDPESVWNFSSIRTTTIASSFEDSLEKLYGLYVGRNFANSEYVEQIMVRETKKILNRRGIFGFSERTIEDEIVPVKFPLVSENNGTFVIKPISLSQKTTIGIIDHAATWHDRIKLLISRGRLEKGKILLSLSSPELTDSSINEAYETARHELENLGVEVIQQEDSPAMIQFARRGARPSDNSLY